MFLRGTLLLLPLLFLSLLLLLLLLLAFLLGTLLLLPLLLLSLLLLQLLVFLILLLLKLLILLLVLLLKLRILDRCLSGPRIWRTIIERARILLIVLLASICRTIGRIVLRIRRRLRCRVRRTIGTRWRVWSSRVASVSLLVVRRRHRLRRRRDPNRRGIGSCLTLCLCLGLHRDLARLRDRNGLTLVALNGRLVRREGRRRWRRGRLCHYWPRLNGRWGLNSSCLSRT